MKLPFDLSARIDAFMKPPAVAQKSTISAVRLTDLAEGSYTEFILAGQGRITPRKAADFYQSASAVAIAVDTIADEIEQIRPVLRFADGRFENSHEVLDLLNMPNPDETYAEFVGALARYWLLSHDAYMQAVGNVNSTRGPAELYAVAPQLIHARDSRTRFPQGYSVTEGEAVGTYRRDQDGNGRARYIDGNLKELYHVRGFTSRPLTPYSDSPLEAAALEARQTILGRHHNLRLLENGARLSLIAVFKDSLTEDEYSQRKQRLNEQLAGSQNAGRIAVVNSEDFELQEVGINNRDMDFSNLDMIATRAIFNRYKIPLPLVLPDATTFNNMENATFHLYDFAVIPCFQRLARGLSRFLLPRYGLDPTQVEITYNPETIPALMTRRLSELERRRQINVETLNEYRQQLPNRDPVEGGDVVLQPINVAPVANLAEPEDSMTAEDVARMLVERGSGNQPSDDPNDDV